MFRSERLEPVKFCWGSDDTRCAWAQGTVYGQSGPDVSFTDTSTRHRIDGLGFDKHESLWTLSGGVLSAVGQGGAPHSYSARNVVAVSYKPELVAVTRTELGLSIEVPAHSIAHPWPFSGNHDSPTVKLCPNGRRAFVSAESHGDGGTTELALSEIDLGTGTTRLVFQGTFFRYVGSGGVSWDIASESELLVLGTTPDSDHNTLFLVKTADGSARPLSPPNFEVDSFAVSSTAGKVAMTGTTLEDGFPGIHSHLLCLNLNDLNQFALESVSVGTNIQPHWCEERPNLFYIHATGPFGSSVVELDTMNVLEHSCHPCFTLSADVEDGFLSFNLPGDADLLTAIVYVQGPHKRLVAGPQNTMFHHALLSLCQTFAHIGVKVICFNTAWSARIPTFAPGTHQSWNEVTERALLRITSDLRTRGIDRVALIAGSLGALPTVHVLSRCHLSAAVLVCPVYTPRIKSLSEWSHLFSASARTAELSELAPRIKTPTLVVHGLRDEVAPSCESSQFVSYLAPDITGTYLTIPEEPHIFQTRDAWNICLQEAETFLGRYLFPPAVVGLPALGDRGIYDR